MFEQEGGQVHQMVHMHGDIALSTNAIARETFVHQEIGHVHLVNGTMVEDLSNSLSKSPSPLLKIKPSDYIMFMN